MENTLTAMKAALLGSFYKGIKQDKVWDAMRAVGFINERYNFISDVMPIYLEEMGDSFPDETKIIAANWETIRSLFKKWNAAVTEYIRNLTEEEVRETPGYSELLRHEFVTETRDMLSCIRTILGQIESITKKSQLKPLPEVAYTPQYLQAKKNDKTYKEEKNKRMIDNTEQEIRVYLRDNRPPNKTMRSLIQSGPWKRHWHAYLKYPLGNHRIVYVWDGKTVLFERLGTHKELRIPA
ncbi:hypothetical protein KY346_00390 [Candidatus Woesearchaeota archaeon]|nr:hypothetical protein [Candidatus Woesearchaeota archaeon]